MNYIKTQLTLSITLQLKMMKIHLISQLSQSKLESMWTDVIFVVTYIIKIKCHSVELIFVIII